MTRAAQMKPEDVALEISCYASVVDVLSGSLDPEGHHMDAFKAVTAGLRRLADAIDGTGREIPCRNVL